MKRELVIDAALVASVLFLTIVLCGFANASRSCLNKAEAARTWPMKALVRDDDGCWTFKKEQRRVPVDEETGTRASTPAELLSWLEASAELRRIEPALPSSIWLDRWPEFRAVEDRPARIEEETILVTPRTVVMVIAVVALTLAVFEVLFGGKIPAKGLQNPR